MSMGIKFALIVAAVVAVFSAVTYGEYRIHAYVAEHDKALADVEKLKGENKTLTDANHGLEGQLKQTTADLKFAQGQVKAYMADKVISDALLAKALGDLKNVKGYNDRMPPVFSSAFDWVRRSRAATGVQPKPAPQDHH